MIHAKEKGSRLERKVAQKIRLSGLDKHATRMVLSGAAFGLETDIRTLLPYAFEVKNQEKVKLWEWWVQAEKGRKPFKPPVLIVGGNYRPQLAVMNFDDWLNILKELEDLKQTSVARQGGGGGYAK